MVDSKYFGIPFGTSGDRVAIPEATQPSGAVSYTQGFGSDYERDPGTDPLAKRVPRDETNDLYYQVTNALKWLQLYGTPEWYAVDDAGSAVSYPLLARVRHAGSLWQSIVATNTAEPGTDGTKWVAQSPYPVTRSLTSYTTAGVFSFTAPRSGWFWVECYGGGGGASRGTTTDHGEGGGGGGFAGKWILLNAGQVVSVTVGAAGTTGTGASSGTAGGTSSFGAFCSASGGGGAVPSTGSPGAGGTGTGGDVNLSGQNGTNGVSTTLPFGRGGDAAGPFGGKSAQSVAVAIAPGGGGSYCPGSDGISVFISANGAPGAVYVNG